MANYKRKDHLYSQAKEAGVRSRAHYKLEELDKRFRLFRPGMQVVELGAWPGGWSQYVLKKIGEEGKLLAFDLKEIDEIYAENFIFEAADVFDPDLDERIREHFPRGVDVVISDMSPKLTGIRLADQAGIVNCAESALRVARSCLRPGGKLVAKLFKGSECDTFVRDARGAFEKHSRPKLRSTRGSSNEFYFAGLGLKPEESLLGSAQQPLDSPAA